VQRGKKSGICSEKERGRGEKKSKTLSSRPKNKPLSRKIAKIDSPKKKGTWTKKQERGMVTTEKLRVSRDERVNLTRGGGRGARVRGDLLGDIVSHFFRKAKDSCRTEKSGFQGLNWKTGGGIQTFPSRGIPPLVNTAPRGGSQVHAGSRGRRVPEGSEEKGRLR